MGARTTKQVPVAAAYDCLEAELRATPGAREVLRSTQWPSTYDQHRYRHLPGDSRDVYPLSLYADGAQCTKQKGAGKVDSMIGITITNAATRKYTSRQSSVSDSVANVVAMVGALFCIYAVRGTC